MKRVKLNPQEVEVFVKDLTLEEIPLEEFCRLFKRKLNPAPIGKNEFGQLEFDLGGFRWVIDPVHVRRRGRRVKGIRIFPTHREALGAGRIAQVIAAKLAQVEIIKSSNPEEGNAGKEDKKDTDLVDGSTKSGDASHGGDNASQEVSDSPNAAQEGEQEQQNSDQEGESGEQNSQSASSGQGDDDSAESQEVGESDSDNDSQAESNEQQTQGSGSCPSSPEDKDVDGEQKSECPAGGTQCQGNKVYPGDKAGGVATAAEVLEKVEDSVKAALNMEGTIKEGSDEEFVEAAKKVTEELAKKLSPELLSDLADKISDILSNATREEWDVESMTEKAERELLKALESAKSDYEFDAIFDESAAEKTKELDKLLTADSDLSSWRKDFNKGGGAYKKEWLIDIYNAAAPSKKTLRAMKRVFDKILKSLGGDTEVSPRLDKKLLIRKLAEYKSPYSARKLELGDGRILITVDTSLSMSGFYHFAKFALDLAKKDTRVVVVLNGNMYPWYLFVDGKGEFLNISDPVDYYSKLVDKYNIEKAIVVNDLDGYELLEELYPRLARKVDIIHIDNYACSYGVPRNDKPGGNTLVDEIFRYCHYWWGVGTDEDILYVLRKTWKVK